MEDIIVYHYLSFYDLFVEEMEKSGYRNKPVILEEKDVDISDDDEIIYVSVKDCQSISIRGIQESFSQGRLVREPHHIHLKIFDSKGEELMPEDTVQFSIREFKKAGLVTDKRDSNLVVYYHYPYNMVNKLKLKKGILITKDKRLEIRIMRERKPIKIGKMEIKIECDQWFKDKLINL